MSIARTQKPEIRCRKKGVIKIRWSAHTLRSATGCRTPQLRNQRPTPRLQQTLLLRYSSPHGVYKMPWSWRAQFSLLASYLSPVSLLSPWVRRVEFQWGMKVRTQEKLNFYAWAMSSLRYRYCGARALQRSLVFAFMFNIGVVNYESFKFEGFLSVMQSFVNKIHVPHWQHHEGRFQ